jgi:hypothetical protein
MKILVTVILILVLAVPAGADPLFEGGDDPLGGMIKGGLVLGGLGFTSAFFLSAELKDLDVYHDDVTDPFIIGSGFGALGLATGVHLGNGRRGNWLLTTLTSGLMGAVGTKIIVESEEPEVWVAVVPALQLAATIAVENLATPGRRERQKKNAGISNIGLAPTPDGGCLLIRGTF